MPAARNRRSVKLRASVGVEVTPTPFVPFESVRALDLYRLAHTRHEVVELGQFEAGCCKRTARAVIRQGRVTEVTVDSCSEGKANGKSKASSKATPGLARLMAAARAKLTGSTPPRPRLPMPVARFFRRNQRGDIDIDLEIEAICLTHCIDFFGTKICTVCCIVFSGGGEQINCGTIVHPF